MFGLCKYKDWFNFGEPGTGLHSIRIFNIAIMDVLMTVIGAFLISKIFRFSFLVTLAFLFILGIAMHRLFCVRTTVDKFLFPKVNDNEKS